jgi:predicted transcriptional regulator
MGKSGKPYKPTASEKEFVRYAAMAGTSQVSIAESLGIALETLRKHFKGDLLTARAKMIHAATKTVYEAAEDGNVDAAKFILARAAKWTEKTELDLTNSDGALTQPRRIIIEAAPLRTPPALEAPAEPESDPKAAQ